MNEFDDLDDLDEVFGPLRSPAQSAELSRESATIDLMVDAHHTLEGKHMLTSRRARIATLVVAGVLGFGGMAAASSPGLLGEQQAEPEEPIVDEEPVVEDEAVDEEEPVVEKEPVVEDEAVDEEEPVVEKEAVVEDEAVAEDEPVVEEEVPEEEAPLSLDDPNPATDFNEAYCEDGNHGKTVSAVARGVFDPDGLYPGEVTVKMAAQSSCGKFGDDLDDGDVDEEFENETDEVEEFEVEKSGLEESEKKAERPGNGGKRDERAANAKSNGNSRGNGSSNGKRGG